MMEYKEIDAKQSALRGEMTLKRTGLDVSQQEKDSRRVFARIKAHEAYSCAKIVMAYAATRGELSLRLLLQHVLASNRMLLLPKCEGKGLMTARLVRSLSELVPGRYGIWEPSVESEIYAPEGIDLVLVPGIAFDRTGGRIGQGGGYYDRFLTTTHVYRMGVCHDFALFETLPQKDCDARMDAIVTPGGIIIPNQKTL